MSDIIDKYGAPGETDEEGFNPYADTVGPGIYSGNVVRSASGAVMIGAQYQGHNPRSGPLYSGKGYTPVARALSLFRRELRTPETSVAAADRTGLGRLLQADPALTNEVSTGGASPLHSSGMSRENQHATAYLISRGGDIEALDTLDFIFYSLSPGLSFLWPILFSFSDECAGADWNARYGYTALHRMASNNLAVGARALLEAGADPASRGLGGTETPLEIAVQSGASDVVSVLTEFGATRKVDASTQITKIKVVASAASLFSQDVLGTYHPRPATEIPDGFAKVCTANGWTAATTWSKLNGGEGGRWFAHTENESYIYYNASDGYWWIDGPDGLGAFKAAAPLWAPPGAQTAWVPLKSGIMVSPTVLTFRGE